MTVGAGSTGQPSNSAGVDYNMRMAAQHLQQPSAPIAPKWGQPPNQQADKSHVTGASQLISASHMGGAKMGGANMMPAGSQLSMQKVSSSPTRLSHRQRDSYSLLTPNSCVCKSE